MLHCFKKPLQSNQSQKSIVEEGGGKGESLLHRQYYSDYLSGKKKMIVSVTRPRMEEIINKIIYTVLLPKEF